MKQMPLNLGLAPLARFDNFMVTAAAQVQVVEHLQTTLQKALPTVALNAVPAADPEYCDSILPTYLWGEAGSGKTHLLQAVMAQAQAQGQTFGCLNSQSVHAQAFDTDWSLVIVDDSDALLPWQQQLAFNWFVHAQAERLWFLAAGQSAPAQLSVRADLKSRLAWGHVFALPLLQEGECRILLQRMAQARGIFLAPAVVDFILARFARDLGHLAALLEQIDHYSLSTQRTVTIPMLRRMMEEL